MSLAILPRPDDSGKFRTFKFGNFEIRYFEIENNAWFIASDVCAVLGIGNTSQAISRLYDSEKATITQNDSGGRPYKLSIITESGLYKLIARSDKPEAQSFQDLVFGEILPTIRKTGGYQSRELTPSEIILMQAQRLVDFEREQARLAAQQEELRADLDEVKAITHVGIFGAEIYSVTTYLEVHKIKRFNKSDIQKIGIKATRIAGRDGYRIEKRHEGIYRVNTYPKSVIEEALSEYEQELEQTRQPRLLSSAGKSEGEE